jgi:hypothetical protein
MLVAMLVVALLAGERGRVILTQMGSASVGHVAR